MVISCRRGQESDFSANQMGAAMVCIHCAESALRDQWNRGSRSSSALSGADGRKSPTIGEKAPVRSRKISWGSNETN